MVATYPFLSDQWMAAAREIRQELSSGANSSDQVIKMNQIVTDVPFGSGTIHSHLDTSSGEADLELGHIDDADVTVTLDYGTAKAILVEGNPQVAMQAFMGGKIKVEGDLAKLLMILQAMAAAPDPAAVAIARRIQEMTE
ncbi:MAG: SCP2 sterol-binding domain-containing protein [Actinomycetota bacterium]|nr:SCP2 sterol-binding domain-containing protein [Actinomycetota bacterium]